MLIFATIFWLLALFVVWLCLHDKSINGDIKISNIVKRPIAYRLEYKEEKNHPLFSYEKIKGLMSILFFLTILYGLLIYFLEAQEISWTLIIPLVPTLAFAVESVWGGYRKIRDVILDSLTFKVSVIIGSVIGAFLLSSTVSEMIEKGTGLSASYFSSYENLWVVIFTAFYVVLAFHILGCVAGLYMLFKFWGEKKLKDYIFLIYQGLALILFAFIALEGVRFSLNYLPTVFYGQIFNKAYYDPESMLSSDGCVSELKTRNIASDDNYRMMLLPSGEISLMKKREQEEENKDTFVNYEFLKITCDVQPSNGHKDLFSD